MESRANGHVRTAEVSLFSAGICPENSPALYRTGTIQRIKNDLEVQRVPAENM